MKTEEKAIFAGGCFWCMQGPFDALEGVISTTVGYTGGQTDNPTYEDVSTGKTGHAEAIQIFYDPDKISYLELLKIFWRNIDPTAKNQQFADRGSQYRTAIFYLDDKQRFLAEQSKDALSRSGKFTKPIVTEIVPASKFFPAEEHHQHYYQKNALHYSMYKKASGRESFIENNWGLKVNNADSTGENKMNLKDQHCKACQGKSELLSENQEHNLLSNLSDWKIETSDNIHKLQKSIKSETFMDAVNMLRDIASIAESEQHHPDFHLYYNKLTIVLYTHKVNGLTDNDFIMASKIDELLKKRD